MPIFPRRRTAAATCSAILALAGTACTADNPHAPDLAPRPILAAALGAAVSRPSEPGTTTPAHAERDSLERVVALLATEPAAHAPAFATLRRRIAAVGEAPRNLIEIRPAPFPR